ncbi:MFS transporter [Virgibacillus salarius]|uniref:MFS transporter n=1 Tax=Virgibacillus salarius TaxID=447199 RepID=UPI0031E3D5B4
MVVALREWRNPLLLLLGIGISNLGGWIYLIALNLIVLEWTGSPLAVSILYMLKPIASIFSSFWAGSYIDRLNKRKLMINLDICRGILILILPFISKLWIMYGIVFVINIADSIFGHTSMVYFTKLIPKKNRQRFNALKNFTSSCGFLLGPSIAGLLFLLGSPFLAIHLNGVFLLLSAVILLILPNVDAKNNSEVASVSWQMIKSDWKTVVTFSKTSMYIVTVYLLFSGVTVLMTAIDSLEAALATDALSFSESEYGLLVSIAGVGFIIGSIVNSVIANWVKNYYLIGLGVLVTAIGYLIFAFSTNYGMAAIGFFVIMFALSFANTGFMTFYQNNVPVDLMGRFSSIFGIVEAFFIIFLTGAFGLIAELIAIRPVMITGSIVLLVLGLIICSVVLKSSKRQFYKLDKDAIS